MNYIVDRRLNAKNKSAVNRQRFLRRYREQIKKAVADAVSKRSIKNIEEGEKISIPSRDVNEPIFHHGRGGKVENVLPGNREFVTGDRIARPPGGAGGGGGSGASDKGEGMDDFVFQITQEEFLDVMFEDLELPNMIKQQLMGNEEFSIHRAGIANEGNPNQINIVRSLRSAHARRIGMTGAKRRTLKELEGSLAELENGEPGLRDVEKMQALNAEILQLRNRINRVPWLDDFDLKYNLYVKQPLPRHKAVMFCLMDVSGSMSQPIKDMAKRFFILLYLFLQRSYQYTEVVFIRHHAIAKEVDEEEFFYSRETGGTIVSSALKLMNEIVDERYPLAEWNVYGAQASDGDNWEGDSDLCQKILCESLMSKVQYYSYIEITAKEHQDLWQAYEKVRAACANKFAMQQIIDVKDIYPVFRELFQKKSA